MCQALCQDIKIDGEPDKLSDFEEPLVQWKRDTFKTKLQEKWVP